MSYELRKAQRQNKIMWISFLVFTVTVIIFLALVYFSKPKETVKNYIGERGKPGDIAKVDYQAIQSYINATVSALPRPKDGQAGTPGIQGIAGIVGIPGINGLNGADSTVAGPPGKDGAPGREAIFQCDPATYDYEWQYPGDDGWEIIQSNSKVCQIAE